MANANAPLVFTGDERDQVSRLSLMMKGVATVMLLLAAINVVGGIMALSVGSPTGIAAMIEGLAIGLLGLIIVTASADVRLMVETKFTPLHLGNAVKNLTVFYKVQFFLVIPVALIRLFIG